MYNQQPMRTPNFTLYPTLSSGRLDFRRIQMADLNEIYRLRSDSVVLKYLDIPMAKNKKDAADHINMINNGIIENKWILWGIFLKNNHHLIGTISLWNIDLPSFSAEIGYALLPDFHRQGYMSEAVATVLDFGFRRIGFQEIDAITHIANTASVRLLEKYNFQLDVEFDPLDNQMVRYFLQQPLSYS